MRRIYEITYDIQYERILFPCRMYLATCSADRARMIFNTIKQVFYQGGGGFGRIINVTIRRKEDDASEGSGED